VWPRNASWTAGPDASDDVKRTVTPDLQYLPYLLVTFPGFSGVLCFSLKVNLSE